MALWLINQEPTLRLILAEPLRSPENLREHPTTTKLRDRAPWTTTSSCFSHHKTRMLSNKCKCRVIIVKMEAVSIFIIHSKHITRMHQPQHLRVATRTVWVKWWWATTTSTKLSRTTLRTAWATRAWTSGQLPLTALQASTRVNWGLPFRAPVTRQTTQEASPKCLKLCCTSLRSWLIWTSTTALRADTTPLSSRPTGSKTASTTLIRSWWLRPRSIRVGPSNTSKILMDKLDKEQTYW